jgi:serine/threonine protein kinase
MNRTGGEDFTGTARFAVVRRIGAGGMGVVFEALDRERGARVALKTLPRLDGEKLYHLKQEFRALTDVTHPNLAALYELCSDGEQWFFTMELIDGVDFLVHLRAGAGATAAETPTTPRVESFPGGMPTAAHDSSTQLLAADGPSGHALPGPALQSPEEWDRVRAALSQLADGVCALHAAGKLHRDIKPSNVLVTPQGRVVLLDFGLVTELERHPLAPWAHDEIAGTLSYMAPEQAGGQPLSAASDWYSVGVMLYEALTGRRPFLTTGARLLVDKQFAEPSPPRRWAPHLPDDLNTLCVDLLRRRPEDRPSGREVRRRLRRAVERPAGSLPSDRPRAPFVGRERHLAVLNDAHRAAKQGRTTTVYVHGRSGAGKSLLVQRFLEGLAGSPDVVILAGRCYERESVPYKALDSLIDALSRHLGRLPREEAAALLPGDMRALMRLFPVLGRVEAVVAVPPQPLDIPDKQELRRHAFAALRELLGRLGGLRRLVLAIDDLQWGDTDSAALLADLLRPPDPPALLLVGSYRSEYAATSPCLQALLQGRPAGDATPDRVELAVEPLTFDEARSLALELLGPTGPAAPARADAVARESGGIPYFVHELVRYLQGGAELAELPPLAREVTLDEVLWQRTVRLPEASRRLLEVVAVSGRPLSQADAYRAAALGADDAAALAVLRAGRLVRSSGPGEQDEVEAYHDRIRETVVAHLPAAALQGHHRRLALTLTASGRADPETLAVHFQGAGERARAGHFYAEAAGRAAEALAFDRAATLYRLSLELRPPEGAEGRALRARLGDALANAGRGLESAREYQAAAAGAGAAEALELRRRAAIQSLISGHIDEGLDALRTVLAAVGMRLARTTRQALASLLWRRFRLRLRGLRFTERDAARVPAEDLSRIDICWSVAVGLSIVDTIRAADFQARSLLLALRAGEPSRVARALAWEAAHQANAGGPARRRTAGLLQAAEALARRLDHPHALGMAALAAGIAAYMEGRWKGGRELSDRAAEVFRGRCTGVAWELDTAHSFSLWSLFFMGEVAEIARRLPALLKEARERGDLYAATNLGTFVGHLTWLAADDPEGARRDLGEVMGHWSRQGFHVQHLTGLMGRLQIDLYRGAGEAAREHVLGQWPLLRRSLFLRVQVVRIFMRHLRARAALAAAARAARPGPLWRAALGDARRIERERMAWAGPLAWLIRAGVAAGRGDRPGALALLRDAEAGLRAADMGLFAAAACYRRGVLLGGDAGRALAVQAVGWMEGQGIRNPARMAALYAPGFGDPAPAGLQPPPPLGPAQQHQE